MHNEKLEFDAIRAMFWEINGRFCVIDKKAPSQLFVPVYAAINLSLYLSVF